MSNRHPPASPVPTRLDPISGSPMAARRITTVPGQVPQTPAEVSARLRKLALIIGRLTAQDLHADK